MPSRTLSAIVAPSPRVRRRPRGAIRAVVMTLASVLGVGALAQSNSSPGAAVAPPTSSARPASSPPTLPSAAPAGVTPVASAQPGPVAGAPCVLLFGQGRNFDPQRQDRNRYWDDANTAFNLAVREPLATAGLPVINVVLPVSATDVPANLRGLMDEIRRRGCSRVLESTVFSDPSARLLIARLRLYPVVGLLGPQAPDSQPRIGAPSYTQQREFALDSRTVERINPSLIGRLMGEEAIAALRPR
ncbi:hypothetical protein [Roseateles chitosanitabidus]|uniref:hypothetical protein n=1 Tax=Roseateles chitosanitabidus TaxID=65048 RepID=UPI0011E05B9D|nr:hypothetical protein [Roseateles chitosanitabidus]